MNKILFALLTISILTPLSGLRNTGDTEQVSVTREYELPDIKRKAWNDIKESWMKNEYRSCIKEFRLKMTCGDCVYIYIKAVITIDHNGKIKSFRKTGENICGGKISPALEKCFIKPLEQKTFPEELKDTGFETMLGTGLKC